MTLDALRQALAPRLAAHPEVKVGSLRAAAEFLTLTVEPVDGPHRALRVAVAPLDEAVPVYGMRWSSYRGDSEDDECDGGTFGDLAFTLRTIEHWIFEGRAWRDVPEFRGDRDDDVKGR